MIEKPKLDDAIFNLLIEAVSLLIHPCTDIRNNEIARKRNAWLKKVEKLQGEAHVPD